MFLSMSRGVCGLFGIELEGNKGRRDGDPTPTVGLGFSGGRFFHHTRTLNPRP